MKRDIAMMNDALMQKKSGQDIIIGRAFLVLFFLLTLGVSRTWAENGYPVVTMTYIDANNPDISYGSISWENTAKAGWNWQDTQDNYPFVGVNGTGEMSITYIMVDATQSSNSNPIPTGNIIHATLHAKVSGSLDDQRQTVWYVDYNTETDLPDNFGGAWGARHFFGTLNSTVTSTSTNSSTFDDVTFDITAAIKDDADRKVVLVVYETAEGGGYIKDPWVEINYEGWSVTEHTVALTDINNDNKITSGMPILYYPENEAVTYTYDGTVLGTYDNTYPPRIKNTGDVTVTATIGGTRSYSYTLHVTSDTGGGTYDVSTKTYTFNQIGKFSSNQIPETSLPPGLTEVSFKGGPTAVIVNSTAGPVLKVIDANGFSHPNRSDANPIPPENNWGGTYYKFVTSDAGTLTFEGQFDGAVVYKSDGTLIMGNSWGSSNSVDLEAGNTYYLYNPNSTPLLHAFSYSSLLNPGLKFKNAQPTIIVDLSEGSYTNQAISGLGLPVTYSLTAGTGYATIDPVSGKVTFKKGELIGQTFPLTITVQASTEAYGEYQAATATYNISLAKTSWIFNDNDYWSTTTNDLGSNWGGPSNNTDNGLDGTTFYSDQRNYTWENLQISSGGLPETNGLLFNDYVRNDRIYLAPKGLTPNYLGIRAADIAIDDVKTGQTVTVDWYAANNSATMSIVDAGEGKLENVRQGTMSLTATSTGRVTITTNAPAHYIRSIKISTPVRAVGTLTYAKTQLPLGSTENRIGYTITEEGTGTDLKSAYTGLSNFASSNTAVATVDASGNVTAVSTGYAFITATASAKSPNTNYTHQNVTLVTLIEVLDDATTRTMTIDVDELLYVSDKNARDGQLDRTVPGFVLSFGGNDALKCNNPERLIMRKRDNGDAGSITITPRTVSGNTVEITQVVLSVSSKTNNPVVTANGGSAINVVNGVTMLSELNSPTVTILFAGTTSDAFEISDIKIYYRCTAGNVDNCLDMSKIAPTLSFATNHIMRVPNDGKDFTNVPTVSSPKAFNATYIYSSSNTNIATISADGTGGQLRSSGEANITATFAETDYFAQSTATYTVSNTLLPGESYDGVNVTDGQFLYVTGKASASNTTLTMENAADNLIFGTTQEQHNTYVSGDASVNLKNETQQTITVYAIDIVTSNVVAWLYYEGQDENFSAQVQFTGFSTGEVKGFKVMDMGDMNNIIDLTNAYEWAPESTFAIQNIENGVLVEGSTIYNGTGIFDTGQYGAEEHIKQVRRGLKKKAGMAAGYPESIRAISNVTVMKFSPNDKVVWNFQNQLNNTGTSGEMGTQWNYTNPGTGREKFYQADFRKGFMPILKVGNVAKDHNVGVLVSGEMRYYAGTSGLRLNLTETNAHIKFPVKTGMEVVIQVASSSADVTNTVSNAKNVKPPYESTNTLYIQREGVNSPINAYYLAASDGVMKLDAGDKVGVYIKSITLQVPELHFEEEIVTEITGSSNSTVNYQPYNAIAGHTLTYSIRGNQTHHLDDADGNTTIDPVAQINNNATGDVELIANREGWVTVDVVDNQATGVEPKVGSYRLYVVNFHFANPSYNITLDGNTGEAYFTERPVGYDKVKTPIEYTMSLASEDARGRLIQYTNEDPKYTTYTMTAYSTGIIRVTATSGNASTSCDVIVGGLSFEYVAPALSENDLKDNNKTYNNPLPSGWETYHSYTFSVSRCAYEDAVTCNTPTIQTVGGTGVVQLTGLGGHGAIRVVVNNNTLNQSARFVLTLSYPASSRKKWAFFRAKDHNNQWGLEIGTIGSYVSYNDVGTSATSISKTVNGYNGSNSTDTWTTASTWTEIFRKGAELPRWGNDRSVKGDNAFFVQETAGLQIETGNYGFYVDQPARDPNDKNAYNHIGLHNNASITIPKLKEGDYVSLNLSRVIPNNGAILKGHNVTDLRGKDVTEEFTITRSQTDWSSLNDDGSRFIPGYYTFIAHDLRAANDPDKIAHPNEFDVSFELVDEGYLDVLSVEIYDGGFYKHTMTEIKLKDSNNLAPNLILKEEGDTRELLLSFCHPMWSTSTGPCEYVFKGEQVSIAENYNTPSECRYWVDAATTQKLKDDRKNLTVELERVKWLSDRGVEYEDGLLKAKQGYGKVVLRMNNYTVEGRYLIGYTPDYTLNVGVIPHQDYPHTWNFTNISGGEVKGRSNNVYNSIKSDNSNWIKLAGEDDVYELNTDYRGASLYVPGGELVSTDRILGQRGENPSAYPARGYDELNALGVDGKIMFPLSPVAPTTPTRQQTSGKTRAVSDYVLLSYGINGSESANTDIQAGNEDPTTQQKPYIYFGAAKFESSTISSTGHTYRCDGGDTKYVLLKPRRALRAGDVISVKAYSGNENGGLAFWTDRTNATGTKRLMTLPLSQKDEEKALEYIVVKDDGLDGLAQLYVYNSGTTTFVDVITISESYKPEGMGYNLYAVTETTLTIPDLNANGKQDWIYISADQKPTAITNATEVYENGDTDGSDAKLMPDASNTANKVWKYKAVAQGQAVAPFECKVTFPAGTNIYQIGVTHILKEIHPVGGTGWATESRDHSIDHSLTGYFTENDVDAFKVKYDSYDMETATVALTPVEESKGVPANTGMVLRELDATNLPKANHGKLVPLFYPAVSTSLVSGMEFSLEGNMMYPNLTEARHYQEERDGCTKFILTNVHWRYSVASTWSKDGDDYIENRSGGWQDHGTPTVSDAAGFYRMHIWDNVTDDTMDANTAYLLVPSGKLPVALWNSQGHSPVRDGTIGIRGFADDATDVEELTVSRLEGLGSGSDNDDWYTISGMKLSEKPTKAGLYIHNNRKVVIKSSKQ